MTKMNGRICAVLLLSLGVFAHAYRKSPADADTLIWEQPPSFTLNIVNQLVDPRFNESIIMTLYRDQPLIRYFEEAVTDQPTKFLSFDTKFTSPYGYFITSINGVTEHYNTDRTYWELLNAAGGTPTGASYYIPVSGDMVTFNFAKG